MTSVEKLSGACVVVRGDHCPATEIDNEIIMMDVESGNYFSLDPIASDIWRRLAEPQRIDDLCRALVRCYSAPLEVITADVHTLLESMIREKLVKIQG